MTFSLSRDVIATETETGLVLLDERAGRYWQLNGSGAATLRLLLAGRSVEDAAAELARPGSAEAERAVADVLALVRALGAAGLVVTAR